MTLPLPRRRPWLALLLVSGALALQGCGEPSEADLIDGVRRQFERHDLQSAQLDLKTLLQNFPRSAEGRFMLGRILVEQGDYAGAQAELQRAADYGWPAPKLAVWMARALEGQNRHDNVIERFAKMELPDAADDAELRVQVAIAATSLGDEALADRQLASALKRSPKSMPVRMLQSRVLAKRGQLPAAQAMAEELKKEAPLEPRVWQLVGDLALAEQPARQDTALAAYRKAIELQPERAVFHHALIAALLGAGDLNGAMAAVSDANKRAGQHPQTLYFEALIAGLGGHESRSRELIQVLLRIAPDNPRVLVLGGQSHLRNGAPQQAELLLLKALPTQDTPLVRRLLATAQVRVGKPDEALETVKGLLGGNQTDPDALAIAGQAYMVKGMRNEASQAFAQAAAGKPDDTRIATALALTRLVQGDRHQAFSALEAVAAKDTGVTADMTLVQARLSVNDIDGAKQAVDKLAAKLPAGDPLADQMRGRIAMQLGNNDEAKRHFDAALQKNKTYVPALAGLTAIDMAAKRGDEAKARIAAFTDRDPGNAAGWMMLAEVQNDLQGPVDEVAKVIRRAIEASPSIVRNHVRLIDLYLDHGRTKEAVEAAQAALGKLPDTPELMERLGLAQLAQGDHLAAAQTYQQWAKVQPNSSRPWLRLADLQQSQRQRSQAALAIRRALELDPSNPVVQQAAVTSALQDDRPLEALEIAKKVQQQRPEAAQGWLMEARAESARNRWPASQAAAEAALTKAGGLEAAPLVHGALIAQGKKAEADAFAKKWQTERPHDLFFLTHLANRALAGGEWKEAERLYRMVLEKVPTNVIAMNNLAHVLAMQGRDEGVKVAEKAVALAPLRPDVLDTLATALAATKQYQRAIETQNKVLVMAPREASYRVHLASIHFDAGDRLAARSELEEAIRLQPLLLRDRAATELRKRLDE